MFHCDLSNKIVHWRARRPSLKLRASTPLKIDAQKEDVFNPIEKSSLFLRCLYSNCWGFKGGVKLPMCGGNMHHIGLAILDHTGVGQVHGRRNSLHASVMDEWKNALNAVTPTHGEIMAICDFYFKPH